MVRQHLVRQESAVFTYIRTHLASCLVEISGIIKGIERELLTTGRDIYNIRSK